MAYCKISAISSARDILLSVPSVRTAGWNLPREILSHVSGRDECLYSQCEQQDGVCLVRYYPMSPGVWLTALHRSSLAVP